MTRVSAVSLDSFDRTLLALVQRDNLAPARTLAERVGLSESACQRRLARLRGLGVITADVAIVSAIAVGRPVTMVVEVALEREASHELARFEADMLARPEVTHCWTVTGEADYLLMLQLSDMATYADFAETAFHANPNVRSFRTTAAIKQVKSTTAIPV